MQKGYKGSEPTGLSKGARMALTPGNDPGTTFVVVEGVVGRTSWDGKREWNCEAGKGGWIATLGQQGAKRGKVKLRPAGRENLDTTVNADFELKWEPIFHIETKACRLPNRPGQARNAPGRVRHMHWRINLRLLIKVNGVLYDRVLKSATFNQTCPCQPR